jgi:hypothetical protein
MVKGIKNWATFVIFKKSKTVAILAESGHPGYERKRAWKRRIDLPQPS